MRNDTERITTKETDWMTNEILEMMEKKKNLLR